MKFKIGEKVKIIKFDKDISGYDIKNIVNNVGEIINIENEEYPYAVKLEYGEIVLFAEDELDYEKPCEYCKENKSLYFDSKNNNPNLREVYIEDDGNLTVAPYLYDDTESIQIKINYCPMCGKELTQN